MWRKQLAKTVRDLIAIGFGCFFYAFGLVAVNIKNNLTEGGITGITLILRHWFNIDPAYSTIFLNIPLIILGYKFLGKRALAYTIYGTGMLSAGLWVWQRLAFVQNLNLHHDLFIAGILAGLFGGIGSGIIYRFGGTTGGSDVLARILEQERGIPMGRTLLIFDVIVLTSSLSYLDIEHMMYTLLASFVFSRIVDQTMEGAYSARGVFIISKKHTEIATRIMDELERGVTYLDASGGFHQTPQKMLYCVVSPSEVADLRRLIEEEDKRAFVTIVDVHEALGEGFTYKRPARKLFARR
ncbi:YitT family protein [Schleiferilactobacillus perolens]|jgi:uncharacterized membrane-anchored protein YitT (DUF2179 family)|uniref:DUF2179 domain-containing protein n=1 Tax=Schleiferilactobacillus perolens DSM 12744 TaxID=1423792 RepID=A0A0R1N1T6_9LACO|nr:YitT family protein [Schleiferilactobacillus perolens]KRL14129.1 hypothetical protein FD09_GL001290 [Schleiferilactobacillus perolens DSM 12744]MCI1891133.1 YitT family protein [Schleiferilactobacillus harbinensis]MCI1912453.1 YitT family protein [Schleiferilactobacillus harbinensis]MCI2171212.1 YitT family protein [Schleiferilactobacillus perolens]